MQSAIVVSRLGILVEATCKFLRALKQEHPGDYGRVDAEILRKYDDRKGDGCFAHTRPSESRRRLPEAAQDVYALLEQFRGGASAALDSYQRLHRIFHEQCEVTDDSEPLVTVQPPRKTECTGVISPGCEIKTPQVPSPFAQVPFPAI